MFNVKLLLSSVHAMLAKAETISPEIVAVADEARMLGQKLGVLAPEVDEGIKAEVTRLTGSVAGLTPDLPGTASELERGKAIALALVDHLSMMGAAKATIPVDHPATGQPFNVTVEASGPAPLRQAEATGEPKTEVAAQADGQATLSSAEATSPSPQNAS